MIDIIHDAIRAVNDVVWGWPMLILLVGTHIFLTFRLRFVQRYTFKALKLAVTKDKGAPGDVSQFGALSTALAATLGTGNIVGVAMAIYLGGPGAIFWLWIVGFFGIATKYSEGLLAVKYRVQTSNGTMLGGPMYALERGLKMKWLGILFAIFCSLASFGIGNMVQVNAISVMMESQFNINTHITGIVLFIITFAVIVGGIKSIAKVSEKIVPTYAVIFILMNIFVICLNIAYVPEALTLIVKSAFTPRAAGGGFVASTLLMAMRYGVARGLFSNESGLGSAPLAAAAAVTRNPVRQALVSMSAVFLDTIIMCFLTGLMLVTTILKNPAGYENLKGGEFVAFAYNQIPVVGPIILTVGIFLFAWTTVLGWCYYAERTMEYLFGKKCILPFRILFSIVAYIGAVIPLVVVWDAADMFNAFMAIPNLITLLLLSGAIVRETKKYLWDKNLDAVSTDELPTIYN
ncbi:MAG: sodium:alanine symporter family protein [Prevotellaceae bacterium]|jgi:AGCS family alanine or glycine:cation symporter|nr:sodium:alanine symporter family protein [Prevotellaceae bacterium]